MRRITLPRDPIFVGALFVSACLHITLLVGWSNAHARWVSAHPPTDLPHPAMIYRGLIAQQEAEVVSKPAKTSSSVLGDYVRALVELPKLSGITTNRVRSTNKIASVEAVQEKTSAPVPKPIPRRSKRKARVENIDLSDARVFEVFTSYYVYLSSHIKQYVKYPPEVLRDSKEGHVYISFVLHRSGNVSQLKTVESSGDRRFDDAALDSIRAGVPFPQFPMAIKEDKMTLYLPVSFQLD